MEEDKKEYLTEWNFEIKTDNNPNEKNSIPNLLKKKKQRESEKNKQKNEEEENKQKEQKNEEEEEDNINIIEEKETPGITIDNAADLTEEQKLSRKNKIKFNKKK